MLKEMNRILFNNVQKFDIKLGNLKEGSNINYALTLNKNLNTSGYSLDEKSLLRLSTQTPAQMTETWNELISIIKEKTNMDNFSKELYYPNFPEEVMSKSEEILYIEALMQYTAMTFDLLLNTNYSDDIRKIIMEDKKERLPLIEEFPKDLKMINLANLKQDLTELMDNRIHSMSINNEQKEELFKFANVFPVEFANSVFSDKKINNKDILTDIAIYYYKNNQENAAIKMIENSKDALRVAMKLSNTKLEKSGKAINESELTRQTKFALNGKDEKLIYKMLNNCKNIYFDIWRGKEDTSIYKRFFNRTDKSKASPRIKQLIDNLYTNNKKDEQGQRIFSIPRQFELSILYKDYNNLKKLISANQGYFIGNFTKLLSLSNNAETREQIIQGLSLCSNVELFQLLKLKNWIRIKEILEEGSIRYCNARGNLLPIDNKNTLLDSHELVSVEKNLMKAITCAVQDTMNLGKVYIDPELNGRKAPSRQMKDCSNGSIIMPGSIINNDKNKNLLMYMISWKNHSTNSCDDIDISAICYNANFEEVGNIYYGNRKNKIGCHSGDYTDAPNGATEAIVIDKELCKKNDIKFVAITVHGFSVKFKTAENLQFVSLEKEGTLENCNLQQYGDDGQISFYGEVYEPSQAEDPIKLNANSTAETVLLYNVEENHTLWIDNYDKNISLGRNVANNSEMIKATIEHAYTNPMPTLGQLFEIYAKENGEIITDISEADIVFTSKPIDSIKENVKADAKIISGYDLDYISATFCGKPVKIDKSLKIDSLDMYEKVSDKKETLYKIQLEEPQIEKNKNKQNDDLSR